MSRQSNHYVNRPYQQDYSETFDTVSWRESARVKLFFSATLATFLFGLVIILFQPVVYRSHATVLMSAPEAVDAGIGQEDIQKVAIQKSILLGVDIVERLQAEIAQRLLVELDRSSIKKTLRVDVIPETNLVELAAEGGDREMLPAMVEAWIDVYLNARAGEIQQAKVNTIRQVKNELSGMNQQLEYAREALDRYRKEHGIISAERQENEVMAKLQGLNKSLNNAIENEVNAKAYFESVKQSVSAGKTVVPERQVAKISQLQSSLGQLQTQLVELQARYTTEYINKQPRLREIPQKIAEIKRELKRRLDQGGLIELESAEQKYTAARIAVVDLEAKLYTHKQAVSEFSRVYATYQSLVDDLTRLEEINREAQARLVQIEVQQVDKYPQVQVITRPSTESERIGPPYFQYFLIDTGLSVFIGIFCVWLYGFLGHRTTPAPVITLSGVDLYPQEVNPELPGSSHRTELTSSEKPLLQNKDDEPDKESE